MLVGKKKITFPTAEKSQCCTKVARRTNISMRASASPGNEIRKNIKIYISKKVPAYNLFSLQ